MADIAGLYRHEGPIAATLEVRADAGQYVVRLEGGGSAAAGSGERGGLRDRSPRRPGRRRPARRLRPGRDGHLLLQRRGGEREGRSVEIVFEPGAAEVIEAGTLGYCGWDAELSGRYRAVG